MSQEFDALVAQAAANTDAEAAAVTLLNSLAALLLANPTAAQVNALGVSLKASSDALGAAIVQDTPADPNAPPAATPQAKRG